MRTTIVKNELAVGTFVAVALALGGWVMMQRSRERGLLDVRQLNFTVPHGSGLQKGAPVLVKGIEVGSVNDIELTGANQVRVTCDIAPRFVGRIRHDATAAVVEPALLGTTTVEISPGDADEAAADDQTLSAELETGLLDRVGEIEDKVADVIAQVDSFVTTAQSTLHTVDSIARKIDEGDGLVARLINDGALAEETTALIADLRDITRSVRHGDGALAMAINDPEFADSLKATASDVRGMVEEVQAGQGSLGRLLKDATLVDESTGLIQDVRGSLAKLNELNEEAKGSVGKVNELVETATRAVAGVEGLVGTADRVTDEIADTLHRINNGEGTIAALLNDDAVYRETKSLIKELRESVEDLREQAPINSFLGVVFSAF